MGSIIKVNEYKDFGNNAIMTSDGSGNVTVNAGGLKNDPIVSAYSAGDQSVSNITWTQITFGTEEVDTNNAFASSTFTVPSGKGGKYLIISMVKLGYENNTTQKLSIYKNGSSYVEWSNFRNDSTMDATQTISAIISLAATDTIKIYNWQGTGGTETISAGTKSTRIDITRLIT